MAGTIRSGRIAGNLESEITSGTLSPQAAELQLQGIQGELTGEEYEDVLERLHRFMLELASNE